MTRDNRTFKAKGKSFGKQDGGITRIERTLAKRAILLHPEINSSSSGSASLTKSTDTSSRINNSSSGGTSSTTSTDTASAKTSDPKNAANPVTQPTAGQTATLSGPASIVEMVASSSDPENLNVSSRELRDFIESREATTHTLYKPSTFMANSSSKPASKSTSRLTFFNYFITWLITTIIDTFFTTTAHFQRWGIIHANSTAISHQVKDHAPICKIYPFKIALFVTLTFLAAFYGLLTFPTNPVPAPAREAIISDSPATHGFSFEHKPHQQTILDSGAHDTIFDLKSFLTSLQPTKMTITGTGGSMKTDAEGIFHFSAHSKYVSHGTGPATKYTAPANYFKGLYEQPIIPQVNDDHDDVLPSQVQKLWSSGPSYQKCFYSRFKLLFLLFTPQRQNLLSSQAYALQPKELRGGKQGDHAISDIHSGYAHGLSQQRRLKNFYEAVCPLANGVDKRWSKQSRGTVTAGAVRSTAPNFNNNAPTIKIRSAVSLQRWSRNYKQLPAVQEALTTFNGDYPFFRAIGMKKQLADTLTKSADSQTFIQHRIK